jgi:hypothetical protein
MGRAMAKVSRTAWDSIIEIGVCASRVWLDEDGKVQTHILSTQEILELDMSNLSEEYIIHKP